jgi:hypothetical protein
MTRLEVRLAQDFYPLERDLYVTFSSASKLQKLRALEVHLIGWSSGIYGFSEGASDWERNIREYNSASWKLSELTAVTITGVGDDVEKEVFEKLFGGEDRKSVASMVTHTLVAFVPRFLQTSDLKELRT